MAIRIFENRLFVLDTHKTTYAMGVDANGLLRHLYYGANISHAEDFLLTLDDCTRHNFNGNGDTPMEEFSSYGCLRNKDTSFKVAYPDRTRDFRYTSTFKAEDETIVITLSDVNYGCEVKLNYTAYPDSDIIARSVSVCNTGEDFVRIDRLLSMELALPGDGYSILNCSGSWGREQQLSLDPITAGRKVFESKLGTTGFAHQPYFAATRGADERTGEVWFGALKYNGNFKVSAEAVAQHYLNILVGISDAEFELTLKKGESFTTPTAYIGFTQGGFGEMSRILHAFAYAELMPKERRDVALPVLYNSWYSTLFDVFDEDQMKLADKAAELGVELFVIDDGWFGKRNDDYAGLGDWYVNPEKFPNGLEALIDHVHGLGMKFGLWIEPEMVNPDSDLYRAHPDWIYRYERREVITGRHQYTLNMTNPDVVNYLIVTFDDLLTRYGIDYIKWDMNRPMAEAINAVGADGMVWHEHSEGVMRLAHELRARHPQVEFEACAGGGSRVNYETMSVFDEFWPSDNVNPLERYAIQLGYSYFYPAKYMRAWITDDDRVPLEMRSKCAMCGSYGIGTNLNANTPEELATMKADIALYKRIRPLVQFGELYRLHSELRGGYLAWQYVKDGHAAVITLVDHMHDGVPEIRLEGLEPDALYKVGEGGETRTLSGAYLMNHGIRTTEAHDRAGSVTLIEKVD